MERPNLLIVLGALLCGVRAWAEATPNWEYVPLDEVAA